MNFKPPEPLKAEVNITQLIDVVLLLLIFFMISTSFVVQPGLKIQLPEAEASEADGEPGKNILLTEDGEIYFEKGRVVMEDLPELFEESDAKELLIIKADKTVPHGVVVEVMDYAKGAGFQRLAIATTPKKDE